MPEKVSHTKAEPPVPIAVLASGRGSNFDAIWAAVRSGKLAARITQVLSDRESAPVLERARNVGLPARFVDLKGLPKEEQERKLLDAVMEGSPRFLVLAGFMRILGPQLLKRFRADGGYHRVVNVHPSLLPAFPGLEGYRQAFDFGAQIAGVTVHLVDERMDHGPICFQEAFSIADCRSAEEVEERGLEIEHRVYSRTLSWVLPEKFRIQELSEGRSRVCPS